MVSVEGEGGGVGVTIVNVQHCLHDRARQLTASWEWWVKSSLRGQHRWEGGFQVREKIRFILKRLGIQRLATALEVLPCSC